MDNSKNGILSSVPYLDILREIALYTSLHEANYDINTINEITNILPYNIKNEDYNRNKPLIEILNDLNIYPVITTDNFYLLIRSIRFKYLDAFDSTLKFCVYRSHHIVLVKKYEKEFIISFKQIYGDKYNSVLDEIASIGSFGYKLMYA